MYTTALITLLMLFCARQITTAEQVSRTPEVTPAGLRVRITVRLYGLAQRSDSAAPDSAALADAIPDMVNILYTAGVALDVQRCEEWHSDNGNDPCGQALRAGEFSIRTYRSLGFSRRTVGNHQLAYSLLDFASGEGSLVTIDLSAVEWLADASGSDRRVLLARVMAHELGHLLLKSPDHSKSGLMRAMWSKTELRRDRAKDWVLTERQVADIRQQRVAGRTARRSAAALIANARN